MGATQSIPTGPAPHLVVKRARGDLTVSGWDRQEILIRCRRSDELQVQANGEVVEFSTDDDCTIQAPLQTQLHLASVEGDATVSLLLGSVTIGSVDGDLSVASVGALTVGSVDGDLTVRAVAGGVKIDGVGGDARVVQIAGDVQTGSVGGDLTLTQIVGNVHVQCDGDAKLMLALAPGQQTVVNADGDITCQVQADAAATVQLRADGDIRVKNLGEPRRATDTTLTFALGDGSARLDLAADGDIHLRGVDLRPFGGDPLQTDDFGAEMGWRAAALSQQITQQVEEQVGAMTRELEEKLARMGNGEEMATRIQDRVASALRRAEEKFAEAMRKIEVRDAEAERRGAEGEGRRRKGYTWAPPPPPTARQPAPKPPPATDEERMLILRMVEEGKLSVEQAEKLLAALGGNQAAR